MKHDFTQAVTYSHQLMEEHLSINNNEKKVMVDATAGNGYDTLFLAKLAGSKGKVYAFDIQELALEKTRKRLQEQDLLSRVKLIKAGHQELQNYVKEPLDGIIFNLGYLPGGDKEIKTKVTTTIQGVKEGVNLLKTGGLLVIVAYAGHPGGLEEVNKLTAYLKELDGRSYNVLHYHFLNQQQTPPQLLAVIRR